MLKRKFLTVVAAIILALTLGYGLLRLFTLRWERGDIYPPYSTLRTDPLGMRALFEAVEALPRIEVRRNFRPLQQLRPEAPVTLIYAGVPRNAKWGKEELRHFESLIASGSRAVFAFKAENIEREKPPEKQKTKEDQTSNPEPQSEGAGTGDVVKDEEKVDSPSEDDEEDSTPLPAESGVSFSGLGGRWGFAFDVAKGKRAGSFHGKASADDAASGMEQELSWHTALRFTKLASPWRVLYRAAGEPVIIERRWGDGTIVLASDSFFLSNEALMNERSASLLAWLIGPSRTLIFDEEHLGVVEDVGLVTLVRKYRLQGALAALALVGLLWIWRQSIRFVPVHAGTRASQEYVVGLDSHTGFISLLRRTVPPSKAFEVCVEEWRKTFHHDKKALATVEQAVADSTPANSRKADPAAIYQAVTRALKESRNRQA